MAAKLVRELLDTGIHFGHRVSRWNPKMQPYIFGKRNKIHIIDVKATIRGLLLARKYLTRTVAGGLDVLFVDGDHKYEAVVADIKSWRPKMRTGALMCGHDFTNKCGVEPAVRELLPQFGQVPDTSLWYAVV